MASSFLASIQACIHSCTYLCCICQPIPNCSVAGAKQRTPIFRELAGSLGELPVVIFRFLWAVTVPSTVTVSQSSHSLDGVAVTCHVQRFYPQNVHLSWLENCHMFKGAVKPLSKQNSDGTYTLESLNLQNVSVQESECVFTHKVQHETQPPIQASLILSTVMQAIYKPTGSTGPEMPAYIFMAFLLGFKVVLVISFIVTYFHRQWKL